MWGGGWGGRTCRDGHTQHTQGRRAFVPERLPSVRTQRNLDSAGTERARSQPAAAGSSELLPEGQARPALARPFQPTAGGGLCASSGVRPEQERCWAGAGPREGAGGVYVVTRKKAAQTRQTRAHRQPCLSRRFSPEALLGLPLEPGWVGASAGLVSLEHTRPSVCPSLLGLALVLVCVCVCV